jgi:hypothetical protein
VWQARALACLPPPAWLPLQLQHRLLLPGEAHLAGVQERRPRVA